MGRKLTDAEKAENAKKRLAKKTEKEAEEAKVKAGAEGEPKADADETRTGGAGDVGEAAGAGDGRAAGAAPVNDPEPAAKPEPQADPVPTASITTKRGVKSRWRAGYQFGPEAREIPLDDLSEDQLEALEADPSLVVQLGE